MNENFNELNVVYELIRIFRLRFTRSLFLRWKQKSFNKYSHPRSHVIKLVNNSLAKFYSFDFSLLFITFLNETEIVFNWEKASK